MSKAILVVLIGMVAMAGATMSQEQLTVTVTRWPENGWMAGGYDPETNSVWWGTGNPAPLPTAYDTKRA